MKNFILLTALALNAPSIVMGADTPPVGRYIFTESFSLTGCANHGGGRGIVNECLKEETKKYAPGDELQAAEFLYDDKESSFGVKVIYLGTNRRIPMRVLKYSPPAK